MRDVWGYGEAGTAQGRALLAERYHSIRRQGPIIYLLAVANLFGLQVAATGEFRIGANPPTAILLLAIVRIAQILRPGQGDASHELIKSRVKQTFAVTAIACAMVCLWCIYLLEQEPGARLPVLLFGSLTALGTAIGLGSYPAAARIPLVVLALPLAAEAALSEDGRFMGAAFSIAVVAILVLRQLDLHNAHFTDLLNSRSGIADERERAKQAHSEALEAATTDFLTGLPNRRAFMAMLEAELRDSPEQTAVFLVDLDRFKAMNDTFGHAAGDELLCVVGTRLLAAAGDAATVGRLGGDEFAILMPRLCGQAAVESAGRRLLHALEAPAEIMGRAFAISGCCGAAVGERTAASSASALLARADIALYHAKADRSANFISFEPRLELPRRRRTEIERALRLPGIAESIDLLFQPIVDLHTGRVVAHEALARWADLELGQVSPAEFIPIAEQLNVIGGLSDLLLDKALDEAAHWDPGVRLSFNMSGVQLSSDGSADAMLRALRSAGFDPARLQVEVTETALLCDFAKARENLERLREQGTLIVLDDFGAGYASISYLREIKFDQVKLDGSLVTAAEECPERQRLLTAVIGLCRALGVEPVAEHIESEHQLRLVRRLGCGAGQGYWLQRPVTAEAARDLLFLPLLGNQFNQSAA